MSAWAVIRDDDLSVVAVIEWDESSTFQTSEGTTLVPYDPDVHIYEPVHSSEVLNEQTLSQRAAGALVNNREFLTLASATAAQNNAQLRALTRQNTALIRLVLNLLDGTD